MGSHKEDIGKLQEQIKIVAAETLKIQSEHYRLEDNINHIVADFLLTVKHIEVDPVDLELGHWPCEESPTGCCVYGKDTAIEVPKNDENYIYFAKDGVVWRVSRRLSGAPKGHKERVADLDSSGDFCLICRESFKRKIK
jgi:hypothetical protein